MASKRFRSRAASAGCSTPVAAAADGLPSTSAHVRVHELCLVAGGYRAALAGEFGYAPDVFFEGENLFADGAAITASAPGGDVPGFTLEATGVPSLVADLDLESGGILTIEDGVDEVIRWTAEGSGRIQLALLTGHHGSSYESLFVCESEDDGELIVPGDLIGLFPREVSDLESHTSWLARYSRDVVDTDDGPIELFVSSTVIIDAVNHE